MYSEQLIRENLAIVRAHLPTHVRLVAVTKQHPPEVFAVLRKLGIEHIGENRGQELRDKLTAQPDLSKNFKLHFIAPLQLNKIKYVAGRIHSFDALDSMELADDLEEKYFRENYSPMEILLQINSSGEPQKSGFPAEDRDSILRVAEKLGRYKYLQWQGLMTMGATPRDGYDIHNSLYVNDLRRSFAATRELLEFLRLQTGLALPRLSMGMSDDYSIATEEGATEVRLGSVLFGPRDNA